MLQLGGGDGDLGIPIRALHMLIGHGLGTGLGLHDTVAGAVDIGTALGSVDVTLGSIHRAVDQNGSILQVRGSTRVGSAGGILCRHKLHCACADKFAPLVAVVYIDVVTGSQLKLRTFGNGNLNTGEQGQVLLHGNLASLVDLKGNVGVNGQFIVLGVDAGSGHFQAQILHLQLAVDSNDHPVSCAVITLGDAAALQGEHCFAGTNELCRGRIVITETKNRHSQGTKAIFRCSCLHSHRHFNVLDVVLRQRKYRTVCHATGFSTAAEIMDLEALIGRSTALNSNGTGAGNVAPGIKGAVDGDGAAALHFDHTGGINGRTAADLTAVGRTDLGGQAQGTVDSQLRTVHHGQRTVSNGIAPLIITVNRSEGGLCRIQSMGCIIGNQQSNTTANRVVAGRQRSIIHQDNLAGTRRLGICLVQALNKIRIIDIKPRIRARNKHRIHRYAGHPLHGNSPGRAGAENRIGCRIDPAYKRCTAGRGRYDRCTQVQLSGGIGCNGTATADRNTAQGRIVGKGNSSLCFNRFVGNVAQHKRSRISRYISSFVLDCNRRGSSGRQSQFPIDRTRFNTQAARIHTTGHRRRIGNLGRLTAGILDRNSIGILTVLTGSCGSVCTCRCIPSTGAITLTNAKGNCKQCVTGFVSNHIRRAFGCAGLEGHHRYSQCHDQQYHRKPCTHLLDMFQFTYLLQKTSTGKPPTETPAKTKFICPAIPSAALPVRHCLRN